MFNQQKPAFKFVIKSKIEPNIATASKQDTNKDVSVASSTTTTTTSAIVSDEKKRKRTEKDATTAAPIATKKVYSQLERWNRKKEELKHESDLQTEQEMAKSEYADLSAMACLLCQRKFKQKSDLERHQAISELHKNNLKDPVAVNKAKLKIQFIQTDQQEKEKEQTVEYRNRAAERRQAYGQPDKPVLSPPSSPTHHHHRQTSMIPRREQPVNQASMYTPIADDNKGARMLASMGWKKGEGLGKDGSGILDPVKAESYAQSAGIGSTPKRDVGSGGGSYQSRTLDTARKRLYGDR
ncbi:C2H2-type zinc finger transcription factor [Mucor lusitanicus]|uniref:C2H2-type zinc finger transcription factor n=1 Tax=Mucor lusitanicus CBS 277.49 TaxID=747725 RepID=A0A168JAL4_MUCCL|nr:C2H2-type zinc finger transcription factor [Mucor lusitanicus CBS 277.49]